MSFFKYKIEQNKAVNGIAARIPKLPAKACKISTAIISLLNKFKVEPEKTVKSRTTDVVYIQMIIGMRRILKINPFCFEYWEIYFHDHAHHPILLVYAVNY